MNKQLNQPLLRGGQQLNIQPIVDRFAIRPRSGVNIEEVADKMGCSVKQHLTQQNLTILEVAEFARSTVMRQFDEDDAIEFTANMFSLDGHSADEFLLTNEITVQFNPEVVLDTIENFIEEFNLNFVKEVVGLENCFVFTIQPTPSLNAIQITNTLLGKESVKWAEPNIVVKQQNYFIPSDTLFSQQWHLYHEGGVQLEEGAHVDAVNAWDVTQGERSVVVAIADDSVDIAHRDFAGTGKIVGPRDFLGLDFNPSPDSPNENHGTAVAGVAVAEANGLGVVGTAPGCALMPIRTSGYLDDNSIEAIFEWAMDNGADIISNSWGASAINFPLSLRQYNAIERAATEGRNGKGCVILFAAGNSNRPVNGVVNEQGWPNGTFEGPTKWLDGFATHPNVIAVSACTSLNTKSFYSSWGREISVCAPSNNGHPGIGFSLTYPVVDGPFPGRGIVTTDRLGPAGYSSSDYTNNFGGTSSSCPLAAGVAALILSANPDLSAIEVREILESTADKIVDNSTDPQLGNAYGTYDENGHSQWFGYGKVNAFKAVVEAQKRVIDSSEPSEIIRLDSSPSTPIPDNNPNGIFDTVTTQRQGIIEDLQVKLDITHPYIGDLIVELRSPTGVIVLLHNRNGGSANNIIETFNIEKFPALADLKGQQVKGDWSIFISDNANRDIGILNSWEIVLEIRPSNAIKIEDAAGELIPDADPEGITRTIEFPNEGTIQNIKVGIDVTHTFISDLVVTLISPSGKSILLHDRSGGSADNLLQTYTPVNFTALADLQGDNANGIWQLSTKDLVARDTGKLNVWSIELELTQEES